MTIHISSGLDALKAAKKVSGKTKIVGVTILTSFINKDLKQIGFNKDVKKLVLHQARLANQAKLDAIVCSAQEAKIVKKVFQDKLHELIGEHELDFFVFQEAIEPWKVHADLRWYPDKIPHKTICVPLDVVDNNEYWSDTYTIIFKQRNYFRKAPNTNESSYGNDHATWSRPIDDINTENVYSGYKITEQQHKEYFSHMPYDALEGLEIESINLWEPNSVIFWGQNQIHCSDNFIANNIQTKKSLIFFTNIKPN